MDNNLSNDIVKQDDILLLRIKKDNPKLSKDIYTPPLRTVKYEASYVNRGPRCRAGNCAVADPINASTGNYYYEGKDFIIRDFEDTPFYRYYNSTGPQLSNIFGNGFTTPFESYISYDKNGNIIFFMGDGKIYKIDKISSGYSARKEDNLKVTVNDELVTIQDSKTKVIYQFDKYGYLTSMITKEGRTISIQYDDYSLISHITIGAKTLTVSYNENKLVKEIALPDGRKVSYKYDANRNLIEFVNASGDIEKYNYDSHNYLISRVDKRGHTTAHNTYDAKGRVTKQIDANGNATTFTYTKNTTTLTYKDGRKDQYTFNDNTDITSLKKDGKEIFNYMYDSYGNMTRKKDAEGNITTYTYDKYRLLKTMYPDGTYEEYRYDGNDNVIYHRDQEGNITENAYNGYNLVSTKDSKNESVNYNYDSLQRIIKETDSQGVSKTYTYIGNQVQTITHSSGLIEKYSYDSYGNIKKEEDNFGKNISYIYDLNNQIVQKNYYDGSNEKWTYDGNGNILMYQDRKGAISSNTYDNNDNLLVTRKGGLTTSKTYDAMNQVISETNEEEITTYFTYDANGNTSSETDIYGNKTSYIYDSQGNKIMTIDSLGNKEENEYKDGLLISATSKEGLETTFEYDNRGREIKKINPNGVVEMKTYDGLKLSSTTDKNGAITVYKYDAYGREISKTITYLDDKESVTKTTYDIYGNVKTIDEDGAITINTYDVYNQLVESKDALGHITKTKYDIEGNVIEITDALGNVKKSTYDVLGNEIETKDANGNLSSKQYDINGLLISETDALGFVTSYHYNNKGQTIEVIDPYNNQTEYTYNTYGQVIKVIVNGKTIEEIAYDKYGQEIIKKTPTTVTSKEYDKYGRINKTTNELTGLSTSYMYDEFGNKISETDSEGLKKEYTYDNANQLIKSIDEYGRVQKQTYDIRGQVIQIEDFDGTTKSSDFDVSGNVVSNIDSLGLETKKEYDVLGQLIAEVSGEKRVEYVYDAIGRVIETKDVNNHTSIKQEYDGNGNETVIIDTMGNNTKKKYNAKNQLIEVIDALGNSTKQEYDVYGNITKEIDALGNIERTAYDAYGQKVLEIDARGFTTEYVYNEDFLLVEIKDKVAGKTTFTYNEKKQIQSETNPNGAVTLYTYDIYGREIIKELPNHKKITTEYDILGNVIQEVEGKKITTTSYDELGNVESITRNGIVQEKNTYNEYNQLIKQHDPNDEVSTYEYDMYGQVIRSNEKGYQTEKEYDVYGNIIKQIDNKSYQQVHTYDSMHRLVETKVNGEIVLQKEYDEVGNEVQVTELGKVTATIYDGNHQPIEVKVLSPEQLDEFVTLQKLKYDESGNVIVVEDANGNVERKQYDANGNIILHTNKRGITNSYQYDAVGNLIKSENGKERVVSYSYDVSNNVTYKTINNKVASYQYDEDGNILKEENEYGYIHNYSYNDIGNKISYTKPDGTEITYGYDNVGNLLHEGGNSFSYDSRGNLLTATNKVGTIRFQYNVFNQMTSSKDIKGKEVKYTYNENNLLIRKEYANIAVDYNYTKHQQLETIKVKDKEIGRYQYNHRGEITNIIQGSMNTVKRYDKQGRIIEQSTLNKQSPLYQASYQYDANDNLVSETVNGIENIYKYDDYDELVESDKYINNEYVHMNYSYDIFGNQTVQSSDTGMKTYIYNDKNQVEKIESKEGTTNLKYDPNGNLAMKVTEDDTTSIYIYDEFDNLEMMQDGQYVYDYSYDGTKQRISKKITDTKPKQNEIWYDYIQETELANEQGIEDSFERFTNQVSRYEALGGTCKSTVTIHYKDAPYYEQPETTEYLLERSEENPRVLATQDETSIYGNDLLQVDNSAMLTGQHGTLLASVNDDVVLKYEYDDYGGSKDVRSGFGYNGEMKDGNGLIYLRARYYDPKIGRFIQIDNNYEGEKEDIASQNRYIYTLNNPYKYVDRDGNRVALRPNTLQGIGTERRDTVRKYLNQINKDWRSTSLNIFKAVIVPMLSKKQFRYPFTYFDAQKIAIDLWQKEHIEVKPNSGIGPTRPSVGTTSSKPGATTSRPEATNPKPSTSKVEKKIELCPAKWSLENWKDFIINAFNWKEMIKDIAKIFKSGFDIIDSGMITKYAKEHTINGVVLNVKGVKDTVKDLTGLSVASKTNLSKVIKTTFGSQMKNAFSVEKGGIIGVLISIGVDIVTALAKWSLGLISFTRFIIDAVVSAVYTVLQTIAVTAFRALLTPFVGPFAWIVALLMDMGLTFVEWLFDVKEKIGDFVEWIMGTDYNKATKMVIAVSKEL